MELQRPKQKHKANKEKKDVLISTELLVDAAKDETSSSSKSINDKLLKNDLACSESDIKTTDNVPLSKESAHDTSLSKEENTTNDMKIELEQPNLQLNAEVNLNLESDTKVNNIPLSQQAKPDISLLKQENATKDNTSLETEHSKINAKVNLNSFDNILQENKKILHSLNIDEFIGEHSNKLLERTSYEIQCTNEIKINTDIKAYTENQLLGLYSNTELDTLVEFTSTFIEHELKGLHLSQHPLHELLTSYLENRNKVAANYLELEQTRVEYFAMQKELWNVNSSIVRGQAECQDGTVVSATHAYNKATFHRPSFEALCRILLKLRQLINKSHVLYKYTAEVCKIQIELYLQTLIHNCISICQISKNAPVSLSLKPTLPHITPYLNDLRICISILFLFQRKLIRDLEFIKETRNWLTQSVAILLRLATYQDHLFLLSHILRCPPGVGSWASNFVQAPLCKLNQEFPFASYEINHVVTILALILMPIEKRDDFLNELMQSKDSPGEALWVMVDSDGEEDEESSGVSLRENDLVSLLNQLPIENLFRAVLLINNRNGKDGLNEEFLSEHHILRFLAFSTYLLKIFEKGLNTYDQCRYNQFSKRLCRFIRHIVQYATDQWEYFRDNNNLSDLAMLKRLQIEYDAFFLRASHCLFTSKKLGAWQFLAVVPYNLVSENCLWKIYYFLHDPDGFSGTNLNPIDNTDFSQKLWDVLVRNQFEEKLNVMEEAESYYLLNTFANMALSRKPEDMEFIEMATTDLLFIGFISETTQENCSKTARILLTHITSKYPSLLSSILKLIEKHMDKVGSFALYLYEELPLSIWIPEDNDIELITKLLKLNPIASDKSRLSRMIISRLNWDLIDNKLFIPYRIHKKIALLVAQVVDEEPGYNQWGWQTIFRLRLHISDKGFTGFTKIQELEQYDVLRKGVREQKLIACFLSVLMTSWGHLIPIICTKGFDQLAILQANQKHEAVLFALNLIVPLFLNCQESLVNCDKFQNLILGLLNSDKGYLHLAKNLLTTQNPILEQFGHMIENQIANAHFYDDNESPRCIVRLWINSLVSVPNWNKDCGVMYLLDVIIRASFFFKDTLDVVINILKDLLQCNTPQEQTNTISSLFKWVSPSNSQGTLLINSSLSPYPWLAYVLIDLEYDEREQHTNLWKEILYQLSIQKGKVNIDGAIKKAANICGVPSFTSGSLCLFRWAQQALDTSVDHPLLPLLWQKFFSLYLYRIPVNDLNVNGSIGEKFFDGVINFAFQKRLKKRLQETVEYYQQQVNSCESKYHENKMFYESCFRLFKAYSLWLEEPRLHEAGLFLPGLPPQYEPQLLALIIQRSRTAWLEYLNYDSVKLQQQNSLKSWRCANYREKRKVNQPHPNPGKRIEPEDPRERILKRLEAYDVPKEAPKVFVKAPIIPNLDMHDKISMLKSLEPVFKSILKFVQEFHLQCSELETLDCDYEQSVVQMYISETRNVKKQVRCSGKNNSHCSGPAIITLQMKESKINERVQSAIETNRLKYSTLFENFLLFPSNTLCISSVTLEQAINILQMRLKEDFSTLDMGVELFYYITSLLNEETLLYLPTKRLFSVCLDKLGQSHICGQEFETPRLLNKILNEPHLSIYLVSHFSPHNSGTANFLLMYSTICEYVGQESNIIYSLLSKFDVSFWLKSKSPKLSQQSKFIQIVIKALLTLGQEPPINTLKLHELYRKHLITVLNYEFPEHFGEILVAMLKASNCGSETGCIATSVWLDFVNYLSRPMEIKLDIPLRDQIRVYAQQQRLLNHSVLLETASLLGKYFTEERFQYGLYGLYPKSRNFVEVFMLFIGMIGHALIISTLNTNPGVLGDQLSEVMWPHIKDMFSPWILPYWMRNMKDNMANWIKQLADDKVVLLPWIPSDGPFAAKSVHMFFECILFIIQTLPASGNILSFVWHWYVTNFAHSAVKDHILNVIHASFFALPWHNFWPTIPDLELMSKVIEQYLPDCHVFLGHIFMAVRWNNWIKNLENAPVQIKIRVHQCILFLIVKLCTEPNVRNNHENAILLLHQAQLFDWSLIEPTVYQHIMDWFVMSYDSLVLFKTDVSDLDLQVFRFLKSVAYHKCDLNSQNVFQKQVVFIRSYVKIIVVFTSKHKSLIPSKSMALNDVIINQVKELEIYKNQDELNIILGTFMEVINIPGITNITVKAFKQCISSKSRDGVFLNGILNGLGSTINDMEFAANLYEATLQSYFVCDVSWSKEFSWSNVTTAIKFNITKQSELERSLVAANCVLTLHAYIMQKIDKALDYKNLLDVCLNWLRSLKMCEDIEPKVPLIWSDILTMSLDYTEMDESCAGSILHRFVGILIQISDEKESTKWGRGLLGAIGFVKQSTVSLQFKFLCRALAGYVLAQLPEMKGKPQTVRRMSNAPSTVGQPGGNMECQKILLKLDFGHTQGKIKDCAELALKEIQNPNNSLHNVMSFLTMLLNHFYMKSYLKDLD